MTDTWVLEFSPVQQAFHLRPAAEGPGPPDWQYLKSGDQAYLEACARLGEAALANRRGWTMLPFFLVRAGLGEPRAR